MWVNHAGPHSKATHKNASCVICFQCPLLIHMHKRDEQFRLQIQYSWKCLYHQDMSYVTKMYLSVSVEARIIIIIKLIIYFINLLCKHKTLHSLRQSWKVWKVSMASFYSFKYPLQPPATIHGSTGGILQWIEQSMRWLSPKRCFLLEEESCVFTKWLMNPKDSIAISDQLMFSMTTTGKRANVHSINYIDLNLTSSIFTT